MTIDFYGRFQAESEARQGRNHLQYFNAEGGTSVGVDPIGIFPGAPHPDVARDFIAYLMSSAGQKLWNWNVQTPGGPRHYALRRMPILPALYADEFRPFRTDPDVLPYEMAKQFVYREAWTGPLFRAQAFIIRVMCIDTHEELVDAWRALISAGFPTDATQEFARLDAVSYTAVKNRISKALGPNKIAEVQLAKELGDGFRAQYRKAADLARQN